MDQIDAMRLFARVVETGNFSAAAREAGVGQPTVSKLVAALEMRLGAQLLHRTSRSLSLTEAGQTFYEAAVRFLDDLQAAESAVGRGQVQPSGTVRVTVSAGFGRLQVVPLLPAFLSRYPDIAVEIIVSDRFVDLIEEGIDVAIRLGPLADSRLVARRIGASPRVTVGSPAYLERTGAPTGPRDLDRHARIAFTFERAPQPWAFTGPEGRIEHLPAGAIRANDAEVIRAAVLAGAGLAQAPLWLFWRELATGEVRQVLEGWTGDLTPIQAVFPAGRRPASKARVFVDYLVERYASDPCLRVDKEDAGLE